jgi:hypothetical protein
MSVYYYQDEFIEVGIFTIIWIAYVFITENLQDEMLKEIIYYLVIFVIILCLAVNCLMS